jgi:hypothetical protein
MGSPYMSQIVTSVMPYGPKIGIKLSYLCDKVSLGGKGNVLELRNYISTSMSSVLDLLTPDSIGNIFLPPMDSPSV